MINSCLTCIKCCCEWIVRRSLVSKVLPIKDTIALAKYLITLETQVELLSDIAHIKYLLVMLLQKTKLSKNYIGLIHK